MKAQRTPRRLITAALLFGVAMIALSAGPHAMAAKAKAKQAPKPKAASAEQVVYKKTTDSKGKPVELVLHVYKPAGWEAGQKNPAIVFFFGGGWVGGTPRQFFGQCEELAKRGMVAVSAEYRIKSKHGTPPQACVEDGKSAVRYLRANAKAMGIDPDRIVASGGSAGGHVAATTGTIPGFEAKGEDHKVSSKPSLMILYNPVIDTSPKTGYGSKKVGKDWEKLSPVHNVTKDVVPTLILHGDADRVVSVDSVRMFDKHCKKLGVDCTLVEYKGAGHGFFNNGSYRAVKKGQPNYYQMTNKVVFGFLAKHGYIKPADKK